MTNPTVIPYVPYPDSDNKMNTSLLPGAMLCHEKYKMDKVIG